MLGEHVSKKAIKANFTIVTVTSIGAAKARQAVSSQTPEVVLQEVGITTQSGQALTGNVDGSEDNLESHDWGEL